MAFLFASDKAGDLTLTLEMQENGIYTIVRDEVA